MITIYTMCIDPERGLYLAFTKDVKGELIQATSYTSTIEAVGMLIANNPNVWSIFVTEVTPER